MTAAEARDGLAAAWRAADPRTPAEILAFYRTAELGPDLAAFHATPMRATWTERITDVARAVQPSVVVDIGCGAGHDLRALRTALGRTPRLVGVEPNERFRTRLGGNGFEIVAEVAAAPIEQADLLICIDVLEHVTDPETFLGSVAARAQLDCVLVETAATHDIETPLHLRANRGWRTGRVLERAGWERTYEEGRLRVWQRMAETPRVDHTALALVSYRGVSLPTFRSVVNLIRADQGSEYRVLVSGEAGVARARSQLVSWWLTTTADEVMLMVDDDISFRARDAKRLVGLCRDGYDVICAAYPTRDASHLALRGTGEDIAFGPDADPVEVGCAATGFLAFSRRVVDAIVRSLPLVNANLEAAFWPVFSHEVVENPATGGHEWLSEDYDFSEKAKRAGFKIYLDPSILLGHQAIVELTVQNMTAMRSAMGPI